MAKDRPSLKVTPEPVDILMDRISLVLLVLVFLVPVLSWTGLPSQVPIRFDIEGAASATSGRAAVWILPFTALFIFVMFHYMNKAPHLFNYPVRITPENARFHYKKATRMTRIINLVCMVMFLFITWSTVQSATHGSNLYVPVMIILLAALFVPIIWYLVDVRRSKN